MTTSCATLTDHGPLKLSERAQELKHHAANWRSCIDGLSQTLETGTSGRNAINHAHEVNERPGQPVNLVHDQDVTRAERVQRTMQRWPTGDAACAVLKQPTDTRSTQRRNLQSRVLVNR